MRRRFAIGQVENADAGALGFECQNRTAGAQFGVVRVRGDDKIVERLHLGLIG